MAPWAPVAPCDCQSCLPGWPTSPVAEPPCAFDDRAPRRVVSSGGRAALASLSLSLSSPCSCVSVCVMTTDDGPLSWEKFRREPATSALVWSFAPLRSSHKRVAAQHCCGRPALFAAPSSWPRKDRALSGRPGRAPPLGRLYGLALAAPFAWSLVTRPAVALLGPCFKTGGAPAFIHSSTHVIVRVLLFACVGGALWLDSFWWALLVEGALPLTLLCAIGLGGVRFLESARTSPSRCTPKHRYSLPLPALLPLWPLAVSACSRGADPHAPWWDRVWLLCVR